MLDHFNCFILQISQNFTGKMDNGHEKFMLYHLLLFFIKNTPKEKLTNEDKFVLMLYTNDIASDQHFQKYINDQQYKNRVVLQFIRPKPIGTLQFFSFIGPKFKSLQDKYIHYNI